MYYPKEIFSINEDVTRKNMRDYDRMMDKMYEARKAEEVKLGRRMTLRERAEFNDNFEKNYCAGR